MTEKHPTVASPAGPLSGAVFHDPVQPARIRVQSLLAELTLDEKISLLHNRQPALPRLGIRPFHTGCEVLHGVVSSVACTVFPQAVGLGATWNPALLDRIGDAVAAEVESLLQRDPDDPLVGRNVWSPVVDLLRDPRWGRNEEGYSEDPMLTAALAVAFCSGLRGGRPGELTAPERIAPTLKHFLAYNHEGDKFAASVGVRPRVLREYCLRPFLEPVRAGVVAAVMPSYHVVNGRPNHLSQHLAVLREGNPDLVVISDGFAPSDLIEKSRYYLDREHAYPAAMRAGLDSFTDHLDDPTITLRALHQAVELGLLSEPEIDAAVGRLLLMRVRLGEFDPLRPAVPDTIDSPEHRALAREAARQSLVLLQNDGVLPLRAGADRTVAVIGPLADRVCRDWYSGPLPYRVTPLDGIREQAGGRVSFTPGLDRISLLLPEDGRCLAVAGTGLTVADAPHGDEAVFEVFDWGEGGVALRSLATGLFLSRGRGDTLRCDQEELRGWEVQQTFCLVPEGDTWLLQNLFRGRYAAVEGTSVALGAADAAEATRFRVETVSLGTESAAEAARNAGSAVVVVGTHPQINGGEGRDRKELGLPGAQHRLVEAVLAANPRTVVVLVSGHPLAVPELADRAPAVLWSSHGGQEFGHGLADVLFGKRSPAGRLPQTWPRSLDDLADLRDYDIIKNRQTYLYSDRDPLYPFGHGLGYSSFRYSKPLLSSAEATPQDTVTITFEVTNTGTVDSDEVPQLYACSSESAPTRPLRRLHGFRRIRIPAGATRRLAFPLPIRDLAFWDVGRQTFTVAPGDYEVMVGPSSARTAHTAVLTVEAPPLPPRDLSAALTRAVDFDDYESVRIIDEARLSGEAVAAERDGAWLLYRDVLLGPDTDRAVFRLGASADRPSGLVQIRVDDPTQGQLLGSVGVPSAAAGRYTWQTVTTPLAPAPGRHDVYLVLTGQTRVATFMLTESTRSAQGGRA